MDMMMSQVSGRAGRKGKRGLVILQTKSPDLPLIDQIVRNDYQAFYKSVIAERQQFHYPPYYRLIYVFLKHRYDNVVDTAALELGSTCCCEGQILVHPQTRAETGANAQHVGCAQIFSACPAADAPRQALFLPPDLLRHRSVVKLHFPINWGVF